MITITAKTCKEAMFLHIANSETMKKLLEVISLKAEKGASSVNITDLNLTLSEAEITYLKEKKDFNVQGSIVVSWL